MHGPTGSLALQAGLLLVLQFTVLVPMQDPPPTLGDIARRNRAQKAKLVPPPSPAMEAPTAPSATAPAKAYPVVPTSMRVPDIKALESLAAAEAKVEDLRDREILLNKNIARFEASLYTATQEGNEERAKSFQESVEAAKTALADTTQRRSAAEKKLDDMQAAAAAARKPTLKPAAPPPKS